MVTYLEDIIPANRFNKIIVFGLSMGGYAALLFGLLTKLNVVVHAIGPQTFLETEKKEYSDEIRWIMPFLNEIPHDVPRKYLDLRNIFLEKAERLRLENNNFYIYYGIPDRAYAERLRGFERVYLYEYNINLHNLAAYFQKRGELTEVLTHMFFSTNDLSNNREDIASYK
ncbi:alpha/beta hydrolase [Paenibacillus typhae]|nr:alpha/beta hydrolase [Paenibacillus typhae]